MILPLGEETNNFLAGSIVMGMGAIIGLIALSQNSLDNFNIRPDIKEDCVLVKTGIYAYIRHPMYASVLLIMAGLVIFYPMEFEYVLYALLSITLLIKMFYEESLWRCETSEYLEYTKKTRRLIPFIF